jgi:malonyl-CoA O-methyltransferase
MEQPPAPALETPAGPAGRGVDIDPAALARLRRRLDQAERPAPWLHGEIARRMADRLPLIRLQPQSVLDWWSQAGGSQALLAQQYPKARRLAVDSLGQPLPDAVRPGSWWRRLTGERVAASVPELPPADLLWSNMTLHWVDDLGALFARWHAATAVDGFLMFSCFGPDTLRELHGIYRSAGFGSPGSRLVDMHDIGDALVHAGFADPVMDMEQLTLTWDSAQAMLDELRSLGRNTDPRRHAGLRTPRWHAALLERLEADLRQPDGRLHLSFEVIYGHAFRPPARARIAAQTEISLGDMREMTRRRNP